LGGGDNSTTGKKFLKPMRSDCSLYSSPIVRAWPTVKPSEKRSFLTLTQFFDAETQFSGKMDGTIRFALLFRVGIKSSLLIWNKILSCPHEMKRRVLNEHFSLNFAPPYLP
jgi:hypothetical protein